MSRFHAEISEETPVDDVVAAFSEVLVMLIRGGWMDRVDAHNALGRVGWLVEAVNGLEDCAKESEDDDG